MGFFGNMFLSDIRIGKVWKVRVLYYLVNIIVEVDFLDCNWFYIVEFRKSGIMFKDFIG